MIYGAHDTYLKIPVCCEEAPFKSFKGVHVPFQFLVPVYCPFRRLEVLREYARHCCRDLIGASTTQVTLTIRNSMETCPDMPLPQVTRLWLEVGDKLRKEFTEDFVGLSRQECLLKTMNNVSIQTALSRPLRAIEKSLTP